MQQDALNNLYKALFDEPIDFQVNYPDLYFIRDLRNSAVGHPTSRGKDDSFHYITRYSIGKGSFELISHFPKSNNFTTTYVNLEDLRRKQEESACLILNKVINMMENEYNDHKKEFKDCSLVDLIPGGYSYSIGKVYEGIYSNYPLAEMNFKIIKESIDNIKNEVERRYGSISSLSGLADVIRRIDYITNQIEIWIKNGELYKNDDAEVFLDSFTGRFEELEAMLKEIDNEFT